MFQSLIEELYFDFSLNEKVKTSKIYEELLTRTENCCRKISEKLGEDEEKLMFELQFCQTGLESEISLLHLKEGIRFGLRLALELDGVRLKESRGDFMLKDDIMPKDKKDSSLRSE